MRDIRDTLILIFITLFLIIGAGVLYQSYPTNEDQKLLFNLIITVLIIGYVISISFLCVFEYYRNRNLPKEKRNYKITIIIIGMMIITLLFAYIISSFF